MITFKKRYYSKNLKENEMILDIETTGLDSRVDKLVLLGLIEKNDDRTYIVQYFAQNDDEEERLLKIYLKKIKNNTLVTYNGDTFDLAFLNNRLIDHKLFPILVDCVDLLKVVKKYRKFFDFDSLKLTDIEKLVNFHRDDPSRYKSISKLINDTDKRDRPYPIMKHNENDLIATELIRNIESYFIEKLSIETKYSTISLLDSYINNDIANLKFKSDKTMDSAYFYGDNYELVIDGQEIIINLQVLYGRFNSKSTGYVSINNFNIVNSSMTKVDEHFLIIKEKYTYTYLNILKLAKKIIENHLWFSICQSISFILLSLKNLFVLENTLDPKNPL